MASLENFSSDVKAVSQQQTSTSPISHTNQARVSHTEASLRKMSGTRGKKSKFLAFLTQEQCMSSER